jgi:hypothetical protein
MSNHTDWVWLLFFLPTLTGSFIGFIIHEFRKMETT